MTQAQLLEGKKIGAVLRESLQADLDRIVREEGRKLKLVSVRVGEDPGSIWYQKAQEKTALGLGIEFVSLNFPAAVAAEILIAEIKNISCPDNGVDGILILDPLPSHIPHESVLESLNPRKDIDGIHPENLGRLVMRKPRMIPSTALSCKALLDYTGIELKGKLAVIVGQSHIVGRPLQLILGQNRVTTVVCNTGTSREQLQKLVSMGDIVIACCGIPSLVSGEWIKPGAAVIDVGTTEVAGQLRGDVDFETAQHRAGFITPVPGGVGPLTVLMLMRNLLDAYSWQKEKTRV